MGVTSRVRSVRASEAEWAVWGELAAAAGLSPNGWVRRACVRQAELERAVRAETAVDRGRIVVDVPEEQVFFRKEFKPDFGSRLKGGGK